MSDKNELMLQLLEAHKERLDSIDDNLKEHMRRTDVLEELHRDNQFRIEALEKPLVARAYIKNLLLDIGKLSGAIVSVLAILRLLGKI